MPTANSLVLFGNSINRDGEMTQHLIEQYYESVLNNKSRSRRRNRNRSIRIPIGYGLQTSTRGDQPPNNNNNNTSNHDQQGNEDEEEEIEVEIDLDEGSKDTETFDMDMDTDMDMDQIEPITFWSKIKSLCYNIFVGDYQKDLLIAKLQSQRRHSMSYAEWRQSALRLDTLTNKIKWKHKLECGLYDYQLIQSLLYKLRDARLSENYHHLLYLIRTNWVRNLGNMGNVNLYRHSYTGTKKLIDEYIDESRRCIEALVNNSDLDDGYLMGILQQTRRNIGRTALVLSGGGTFGLFHIGVLSTLFELDLLPRVISGSSAGAIVASILSVHHKEEIPSLLQEILGMEFNIFKDDKRKSESENFLIKISRFLKNGTWFNNEHLVNTMISFLGDLTFREAYNRTGKILNITVSPASLFEQPRLLNNLTAPNVLIWSAVCASCSLPGIFPSSPLYEKDPKTGETRIWNGSSSVKFVDGSVDNDLPISRLSEMFNVDHIIACQVNIHVVPFLKLSVSCVGGEIEDEFNARLRQNLGKMYNFLSNEMIHILEIGSEMGIATNTLTKLRSVLSQQYSGDITILPDMGMLWRINELLSNPTRDFLLREITNGARATWPKISVIENHCAQEFALDKAITFLKGKIIVSSSIKNPLQFSDFPLIKAKKNAGNRHKWKEEETKDRKEEEEDMEAVVERLVSSYNGNTDLGKNKKDAVINHDLSIQDTIEISFKNATNVLDDNLLETESPNSLLLLNENIANKTSVITDQLTGKVKIQTNQSSSSSTALTSSSLTSSMFGRKIRRKSDSGMVTTSGYYFQDHNMRPFQFTVASPSTDNIHGYSNIHGTIGSSKRRSQLYRKGTTGHIFFPMERRSWNQTNPNSNVTSTITNNNNSLDKKVTDADTSALTFKTDKPLLCSSPSPLSNEMVPLTSPRPKYKYHPHFNYKSNRTKSPFTTRPKSNTTGQVLLNTNGPKDSIDKRVDNGNNYEDDNVYRPSPSSSSSASVNPFFPGMIEGESPQQSRNEYRRYSMDISPGGRSTITHLIRRHQHSRSIGSHSDTGSITKSPVSPTVVKETKETNDDMSSSSVFIDLNRQPKSKDDNHSDSGTNKESIKSITSSPPSPLASSGDMT